MHKYRVLFGYAWRQKKLFLLIFALTLMTSALGAVQPWPMKILVDHILQSLPVPELLQKMLAAFGAQPTTMLLLWIVVLGSLVIFAFSSLLELGMTLGWSVAGRRTVFDLAETMFARLQRRSLAFHSRNRVGDTMTRVSTDSWCVHHIAEHLFFTPLHSVLAVLFMLFLMYQLHPGLTLITCVTAPFMVLAGSLVGKPLRQIARQRREIESNMESHLQQALTGIPVVQAFGQEEREQRRFQQFASSSIRMQKRGLLLGSINGLSSGLISTLGTGLVLWYGSRHVIAGTLGIGSLLAFVYYLNSLQVQLKRLAGIYTALQGLDASINRIRDVLLTEPEIFDAPGAIKLSPSPARVEFENVSFAYDPAYPVLTGINLLAKPGQTIAIVGATGAGKTTLVRLIPRFADPSQGRVTLNGQDLRQVELQSLRSQIALVLQEAYLLPASIADNIAYGRPDASRKEIEAAARAANAEGFIQRLEGGYDHVLGERGVTLSGGERQRLSIARALLKNAPIIILDEPTSSLDAQTEHLVLDALYRLMQGRTTFVIAHRLSTVRKADCIVVLDKGCVVERGSHQELLARNGHYARFHQLQFRSDAAAVAQPVS